jgi:hypothetical protein
LVAQAPALLDTLQYAIKTNLTLDQMIQLAKLATQIDPKNIKQATIDENMVVGYNTPTDPPQNVLVPIRDKIRELREKLFNSAPASNSSGESPAPAAAAARIVVENGTQINGLAARTGDRLKAAGYNVVEVTSADRFDYAQSQIISYHADTTLAADVARTLGLPASAIVTSTLANGNDLTVLLGSDYQADAVTPTP